MWQQNEAVRVALNFARKYLVGGHSVTPHNMEKVLKSVQLGRQAARISGDEESLSELQRALGETTDSQPIKAR